MSENNLNVYGNLSDCRRDRLSYSELQGRSFDKILNSKEPRDTKRANQLLELENKSYGALCPVCGDSSRKEELYQQIYVAAQKIKNLKQRALFLSKVERECSAHQGSYDPEDFNLIRIGTRIYYRKNS